MAAASDAAPLRFRNYLPNDATLRESAEPAQPLPTAQAADAAAKAAAQLAAPSDAPLTIVPKRLNWDLKRDLAPKLARLDRDTQRAIAEILRDRVAAASGGAASGGAASGGAASGGAAAGVGAGAAAGAGASSAAGTGAAADRLDEVYTGPVDGALLARAVARGAGGGDDDLDGGVTQAFGGVGGARRQRYADDDDEER